MQILGDGAELDAPEEIRKVTGGGADFTVETTASPVVFRQAVDCLTPLRVCGLISGTAPGTEASLDMNNILFGRTVCGVHQGDSVPNVLIPQLLELYAQGRFPFDRLIEFYDLDQINQAAEDSEKGKTLKPMLHIA